MLAICEVHYLNSAGYACKLGTCLSVFVHELVFGGAILQGGCKIVQEEGELCLTVLVLIGGRETLDFLCVDPARQPEGRVNCSGVEVDTVLNCFFRSFARIGIE